MIDRVAALYDIHGNLPALEAVLDEVARMAIDAVVVGGDVLPGPLWQESLERLLTLDVPVHFIHGNGEIAVLDERAGKEPRVPASFRPALRWIADRLDPARADALARWPLTKELDITGIGRVLFCHATPRNDLDIFSERTPKEALLPVLEDVHAQLVVCGHTHMQFEREVGDVRVVNAGSVGMAFDEPGAHWLLLGPGIDLRRTPYDTEAAAAQIRATPYPGAEEFVTNYVLSRPGKEAILAVYANMELK